MARLWTDGAEFGDNLFWTDTDYSAGVVDTKARTGNYSYFVPAAAGPPALLKGLAAVGEFYFRAGYYALGATTVIRARSSTTVIGKLVINILGRFEIYRGESTLLATGTVEPTFNAWHLIEWHLKIDNSSGESTIKVDGITDATYSGDTQPSTETTIDNLYFSVGNDNHLYLDDLALNDTSGAADDSWCGDGYVERLTPNGNGSVNQWTGSDSDTTDNYLLVDEVPASSTDYVEDSTPGNQDMYALSAFSGTGKTILRVYAEARGIDTVAGGAQVKLGVRTGGANYLSSAISLLTSYARIVGSDYTTNPGGGAWEASQLDEFIVETV